MEDSISAFAIKGSTEGIVFEEPLHVLSPWEHDCGGKHKARATAMAKLHASETAFAVIDEDV